MTQQLALSREHSVGWGDKVQGVYTIGYAPDNKRVVRSRVVGLTDWEHEVAFYSGSSRLGRYRVTVPGGTWLVETVHEERYFAGKTLMPQDRLGSAAHAWLLPYGQELTNGSNPTEPNDRVKFATYTRDQNGYDYADQRYLCGVNWQVYNCRLNMYAYVDGDPVNNSDPSGLATCGELPFNGVGATGALTLTSRSMAALGVPPLHRTYRPDRTHQRHSATPTAAWLGLLAIRDSSRRSNLRRRGRLLRP